MYELLTLSKPYPDLDLKKITQFDFYSKVIYENYRQFSKYQLSLHWKSWLKDVGTITLKHDQLSKKFLNFFQQTKTISYQISILMTSKITLMNWIVLFKKFILKKWKLKHWKKNEPKRGNNLTNEDLNQKIMKLELPNENKVPPRLLKINNNKKVQMLTKNQKKSPK